jgi:hypothetical protein
MDRPHKGPAGWAAAWLAGLRQAQGWRRHRQQCRDLKGSHRQHMGLKTRNSSSRREVPVGCDFPALRPQQLEWRFSPFAEPLSCPPACCNRTARPGTDPSWQGARRLRVAARPSPDGRPEEARLLIVATDRLSAFDVVLPNPIPGKGEMLTQISNFWFAQTAHLVPNHLLDVPLADVLPAGTDLALYEKRAVVAQASEAGTGGSDRPRLPDWLGLEGLSGHRLAVRYHPAGRSAAGAATARTDLHAVDQSRRRRPRRERQLRCRGGGGRPRTADKCATPR